MAAALRAVLREVDAQRRRPSALRRFVAELAAEGLAHATIRDCLSLVPIVLDTAAEDRLIAPVPQPKGLLRGAGVPEDGDVARSLQLDELQRIHAELPGFYRPLFLLLAHSGLRLSEAMGLRRADLDVGRRTVTAKPLRPFQRRAASAGCHRTPSGQLRRPWIYRPALGVTADAQVPLMQRGYWDDLWQRSRHGPKGTVHAFDPLPEHGYLEVTLDGYSATAP